MLRIGDRLYLQRRGYLAAMQTQDDGGERTGQGYPEEGEPDSGIDAREHPENEATPDTDAPQTSPDEDGDPSQATGNPRAAGGDEEDADR
jgi:hypothetical protein